MLSARPDVAPQKHSDVVLLTRNHLFVRYGGTDFPVMASKRMKFPYNFSDRVPLCSSGVGTDSNIAAASSDLYSGGAVFESRPRYPAFYTEDFPGFLGASRTYRDGILDRPRPLPSLLQTYHSILYGVS
jgi:hypothetical protein